MKDALAFHRHIVHINAADVLQDGLLEHHSTSSQDPGTFPLLPKVYSKLFSVQ